MMRIPGWKHLQHGARWVRSRFNKRAIILGYHRIATDENDVYAQCVNPQHFAQQIKFLRQFARPIALEELTRYLRQGELPDKSVVITFDDGYAETLHQAYPLLAKHDIPANVFVTTGSLGKTFWWDELAWLISHDQSQYGDLVARLDDQSKVSSISEQDRSEMVLSSYRLLLKMTAEDRGQVMDQLRQRASVNIDHELTTVRALTTEELTELARSELIAVGAHTVSHPILTDLPLESQRCEVEKSKQDLEEILQKPVTTFSYPNGAGNETTKALLKQAGYASACSSFNDVILAGSDRLNLPRFWVPDINGNEFAHWLNRWL